MGWARLELATNALKGHCSTIELPTRSGRRGDSAPLEGGRKYSKALRDARGKEWHFHGSIDSMTQRTSPSTPPSPSKPPMSWSSVSDRLTGRGKGVLVGVSLAFFLLLTGAVI